MPIEDRKALNAFTKEFMQEIQTSYRRFLGNELHALIESQLSMSPSELPGYRVGDEVFYFTDQGTPLVVTLKYMPANMMPRPLNPVLMDQHLQWVEHFNQHDRDFPRIQQMLGSLIIKADSPQQLRDMFPDHVIRPMLKPDGLLKKVRERYHPDLYAGSKDSPNYAAERQRREIFWEPKMFDMYESVGKLVDQYLGYKFLA
jgi:hypothetical protein